MQSFSGKWKLHSSENFDEYMKAIGVSFLLRKVGNNVSPVQTINVDGDTMKIETATHFKTTNLEFTIDKEFDETTADDRKVQSIVNLEGEKLIHVQKLDNGTIVSTIERFLEEDGKMFVMVLKTKDSKQQEVVCTRKYAKMD